MLARLWGRLTGNLDGTLVLLAVIVLTLGLFTLYSASYENPGRLNAQLAKVIRLTGLDAVFEIYPDVEAALTRAG